MWWQSGRDDYTSSAVAAERLSNLGAVLHYYPAANGSFFLGGILGLSNYYSKSADAYSNDWGWGFTAHGRCGLRHQAGLQRIAHAAVDVLLRAHQPCQHRRTWVILHRVEAERD